MQIALAWLLHRSPNILLIPGTSSVAHLRENLAAGQLTLSPQTLAELDGIAAAAAKNHEADYHPGQIERTICVSSLPALQASSALPLFRN